MTPYAVAFLILLVLALRSWRTRRHNASLARVSGVEWRIRSNAYFWEKRAKR
jgi:hypothetical protein